MKCHKCGSSHVNKGGIEENASKQRYQRLRCMDCKAVQYIPMDGRDKIPLEEAIQGLKNGVMRIWHLGRAWEVK